MKTGQELTFTVETQGGDQELILHCRTVYVIGFAGRNTELVRRHIEELSIQLGVEPPAHIPEIYVCGPDLLTMEGMIPKTGERTSGEVEYLMLVHEGRLYIGIGSDHTDREEEARDILRAKQCCGKPVGRKLWPYGELEDHWDSIIMRSWLREDGREEAYQDGTTEALRRPEEILEILKERTGSVEDCIIYSGTVPLLGDYRFAPGMRCELTDPVRKRSLTLTYSVQNIGEKK